MRRWTVMLVPHGNGSTRQLDLNATYLWVAGGILLSLLLLAAGLAFTTTYLFQKSTVVEAHAENLLRENRELAQQANTAAGPVDTGLSDQQRREIEQNIREEYEASTRAITAALNELYVEEDKLRKTRKLPPRVNTVADYMAASTFEAEDGKGGPPGAAGSAVDLDEMQMWRPPTVIYGLASPSADLILEEIRLRTQSLTELRESMVAAQDRMERMPGEWPVQSKARRLTSRYGYRKDPFTRAVRHHDGLDIAAPYGTSVFATGRGVVEYSGYERWLGHVVRVNHGDGYTTVYAHLSKRTVETGDEVNRGDEIGKLGSTGRSTGPHLHYEVRIDGKTTDPEKYLP